MTMNTVVIYYSLEGNTELIANMIAKKTGADTIKLNPQKQYPTEGFGKFFWGGKSVFFKEKPKLLNKNIDLSKYSNIIIGTPIWAGSFTPPINTFLQDTKIENKNIYLFACHAGGGTEKCFKKMEDILQNNTIKKTIEFVNPGKQDNTKVEEMITGFCEGLC
jgi:flavodoxin